MRIIFSTLTAVCGLTVSLRAQDQSQPPNIVFILADDLGWSDLGCYGSSLYETPNLDRLAREGMRFTDAYAACNVCSPTRSSILTGKYPARNGITSHIGYPQPDQWKKNTPMLPAAYHDHLDLSEITLAEALQPHGYRTEFIGKWHLGDEAKYWPEHQGFDVNLGGYGKGSPPSYFSPYRIPNLSDGPVGEYLTDRLTDEAVEFIEQSKDRPFFLYLSHYAVHNPQRAKSELVEKYREKTGKVPQVGAELLPDRGVSARQVQNQPVYAAMVESLDVSVGRILQTLKDLNLEANTIVIFTSDNGGLSTTEGRPTSNLPLRLGKGWNYEGGVREPLLIKWPGVTNAGSINATPVTSTDFYPTILNMIGQPMPPTQQVDGLTIVPALHGGALPERPLFWHYPHYSNQGGPPSGAVRLGDFKLIEFYEDMSVELYNLKHDPGERHDLAADSPRKTAELTRLLHNWRQQLDARMPVANPRFSFSKTDPSTIPGDKDGD